MDEKEMKILIFGLNGEYYATDIKDVERILGYVEPTLIPDVPDFVEGVINYEDNVLPIINLSKKFKFLHLKNEANEEEKKIIVVKRQENKFGIIVDCVHEVSDVNVDRLEQVPMLVNSISKEYLKGFIKLDEKIIILLNLENMLSEEEENSIF